VHAVWGLRLGLKVGSLCVRGLNKGPREGLCCLIKNDSAAFLVVLVAHAFFCAGHDRAARWMLSVLGSAPLVRNLCHVITTVQERAREKQQVTGHMVLCRICVGGRQHVC
jgi:hypothetical protein